MPPLDVCNTSFGKLNMSVVKDPYYEASLNKAKKPSEFASIPVSSLLVCITPTNKYDVDHFPTLSDLNDELRGHFATYHTVLDNFFQSGAGILNQP